jgi:sortase A
MTLASHRLAALALLIAMLVSLATASAAMASGTGTISQQDCAQGTIRDQKTGQPISRARCDALVGKNVQLASTGFDLRPVIAAGVICLAGAARTASRSEQPVRGRGPLSIYDRRRQGHRRERSVGVTPEGATDEERTPAPPPVPALVAAPVVEPPLAAAPVPSEAVEPAPSARSDAPLPPAPAYAARAFAAFYDRRAPAALAYCARVCAPDAIADAVEDAFSDVFRAAAEGEAIDEEALDQRLREAVRRAAASSRAPDADDRRFAEAERAYEALSGDDAPALGRSLVAEVEFRAPEAAAADDAPRARRRFLRIATAWRRRLAIVMAVAGVLLLAEVAVTLLWKEPFTGYLAAQAQDDLSNQLDRLEHGPGGLGTTEQRSLATIHDAGARQRKRMSLLAARLDQATPEGEALGRLQIRKLGVDYVLVQGTQGASLRKGPGHYHPDTKLPGEAGVVGIAGHRTTYGAPFRDVDALKAGDRIVLRMPYGLFTYEVTGHRIVPAGYGQAFTAAGAGKGGTGGARAGVGSGGEWLVLSACHPLYSATERILVDARLVSSAPLGAAIETTIPAVPADSPKTIAQRLTKARLNALGQRQLGPGMSGPDVRELQRLLGMPVTGVFDANTSAAVLAFQRDHGLPQVGRAGSLTKAALARQAHLPSRPPTPANVPRQQSPNGTGYGTRSPSGYGTRYPAGTGH